MDVSSFDKVRAEAHAFREDVDEGRHPLRSLPMFTYRRFSMGVMHGLVAASAYVLAFELRFDFMVPSDQRSRLLITLPLLIAVRIAGFAILDVLSRVWRYVSIRDLLAITQASTLGTLAFATVTYALGLPVPRSILLIDWFLSTALVGGMRIVIRAVREASGRNSTSLKKRVIVVGGGDAGEWLLREIEHSAALAYETSAVVDDNPRLRGRRLHGVPVLGSVEDLPRLSRDLKIDEVLFAIPSADARDRQRILTRARECGVPLKTVPSVGELLTGRARIGQLQELRPEDLLDRPALQIDVAQLRAEFGERRVLITGAAGSIGSELCRQIAGLDPEKLIMVERAESPLFFAEHEIRSRFPKVRTVPVIGDILDSRTIDEVIDAHQPQVIFHAAAYKHVPLMEQHPLEAIRNNVFGTEILVGAARVGDVSKFVLISTDKAVRPNSIMGMTKRVAEDLLLAGVGGRTTFVAVRFGNVLGSAGSVLPLLQWQIAQGGPVTITDPEATRYFMLISEASQLVLQAAAIGRAGDIFFLDMGDPVRIGDLADNVVRLNGLRPTRDIRMDVVGLRPGERLIEELHTDDEELEPSEHGRVLRVRGCGFDADRFHWDLETLRELVQKQDGKGAVQQLRTMTVER